jgi:hypothetical protein
MIPSKWLRLFGTAASAAVTLLLSSACLAIGIQAQSAESATASPNLSLAARTPFIVAPSIPLGYAPSSLATGDLRGTGKLDLVTADYSSGRITVFLGTGQGKFAPAVEYDAGLHPSAVAVADINGDGRPDVVVSNETEGTISLLLGNGDGTMQSRRTFALGFNPSMIATGDFTGTGKVGVAAIGASSKLLAILLSDGDGGLEKPELRTLSKAPSALAVADFNNDGRADLALGNVDGTVSILLGNGAGQFHALSDIHVGSGPLSSIVSADLNKDGKTDLIVTQSSKQLVSVLFGKGDGTYAAAASYAVGNEPVSALVADVNGSGVPALVVINKSSNTFSVLAGNGDGTFKNAVDFVAGNAPLAAAAGDFYGNGHVDLAIINHLSQTVSVPPGMGDGTFKAARSYPSGVEPVSIASGNLNGSKIPALVVANYCGSDPSCGASGSISVFLANDRGVYRLSSTYEAGAGTNFVVLSDVNGDGKLDMIALNRVDGTASVLLGLGDGTFGHPTTFPLAGSPLAVAVGDVNKDGKPDLAVLEDCGSAKCSQPGSLEILRGAGDGSFQSVASYNVGYSPNSVVMGDINGDKKIDILASNRCGTDASCQSSGTASVLIGDGTGKFIAGRDVVLGKSPSSIALGSLTGSGADLVVSRSIDNKVAVLRGNGDGTFQPAVAYGVGNQPGALVVADFNGDGKADVAVANNADSTVSVLNGRGDGTLMPASSMSVGSGPVALAVIGGQAGTRGSLATANGNSAALTLGSEVTIVINMQGTTPFTTFTLASSKNPSKVNDSVMLTATIDATGSVPTANVVFANGGVPLADCGGATGEIVNGTTSPYTSTCTLSSLPLGASDSLTAEYLGDATYPDSTTAILNQEVDQLTPTLGLSTSAASAVYGQQVTFTAQLGGVTLSPITPGGTVDFKVGGTTISGCGTQSVDSTGKATCSVSSLPIGAGQVIGAIYSGDPNYATATAATITETVARANTSLGLGTSGATVPFNDPITFTATVSAVSPGSLVTTPGGTVQFTVGGATISGCGTEALAAGVATCQTTLPLGAGQTIGAVYTGDASFTGSTASTISQAVTQAGTSVALGTSPSSISVNSSVTFTATLSAVSPGALTPTAPGGSVKFTAGGTTISGCGTQPLAAGVATCTTSTLTTGAGQSIAAVYTGDANFTGSTGTTTETVTQITPTLGLASSGATNVNQPVTFTATLSGVTFLPTAPTGTVKFTVGGTTISGCGTQPLAGEVATCTTSALAAGAGQSIAAVYTGDSNYATATGTTTQTVSAVAATMTLTPSPSASVSVGTSVTFTAQLTGVALTPTPPSGTVTFTINGASSPDCPPVSITVGTCKTSSLVVPADLIKATYSGDPNFTVASAATATETVTKASPTVTVTSSSTTPTVNQTVIFTATVKPSTGTVLPTGSVTFTLTTGGTVLCNAVTISNTTGVATCNYAPGAPASPGSTVTATYSGDSNFATAAAATSPAELVSAAATTTTLSSTPAPSAVNQQVAFTAVVTAVPAGAVQPTGTVAFTDTTTSTTLCTKTLSGGVVPVCNYTFTSAGSNSVVATFTSGDANFTGSTSSADVQSVGAGAVSVALTSSPNPSNVNQLVTFSTTVNTTSGTTAPQGAMTYKDTTTGTTLCTVTLAVSGNVPACTYAFPTEGTHAVTATFTTSNSNFSSGTSSPLSQSVTAAATTTSLSSSPSSSGVNQSVAFTAVVAPAFTGVAKPTGTVVFTDTTTSTTLCTKTLSAGVVPVCTYTFTSSGSNNVVATYTSGDLNFTSSASTADIQSVGVTPTTTALVSSLPSSAVNQLVTFTATITPSVTGTTNPSGHVAFSYVVNGGSAVTLCASIAVSTTGSTTTAACTASLPANGNYTITAAYSGDANFGASSGTLLQPVGLSATTTKVVASSSSTAVNQSVTFTATVTPSITGTTNPSKTVAFTYTLNGGLPVTLCATAPLTQATGIATCTATLPTAGTYTVSATYSGDANFSASIGTATQTVTADATTTALVASSSSTTVNQLVTFTATVTPAISLFPGSTNPAGTVAFSYKLGAGSAVNLCAAVPVATAAEVTSATCTAPLPTDGSYTITAVYNSADTNFTGSTGTAAQTVGQTMTTTSVVSSLSPSSVNQTVTFTATVASAISGSTVPTGTVAFSYTLGGGAPVTLCASASVSTLGTITTASCTAALPALGSYTITAAYSGDGNFKAQSGTFLQSVSGSATTTTVVASPSPSAVNQNVLFTATIVPSVTGSTNPTGTVAFTYVLNGGAPVTLCGAATVTTSSAVNTATCIAPLPSAASASSPYTITATYSGDANFSSSLNIVKQTVLPGSLGVVVTSSQPSSQVNQSVTFTAILTPANLGAAAPTATVAFRDTLTGATLCADVPVVSFTASCPLTLTTLWRAATHPITATYSGDSNFPATTSAVFPQVVAAGPTAGTLMSSIPTSIATQTVTFTATVTPTKIGPIVPSGYFTFTSSGIWVPSASCQAAAVAPTGNGTATATCTASFPATASNQTITAVYSNDSNFTGNTSTIAQTVQNFSIGNSVSSTLDPTPTTGPVILTQGYATATSSASGTDPFNPTTVTAVVTSTGGFTDTLQLNCQVTNAVHAVVTDPSCTLATTTTPPTQTTLSGANGTQLIYTLSASGSAPVGSYTVALVATDQANPVLTQSAGLLTVYVDGVANTLSLAQGASGTENATFNTSAASGSSKFVSFTCGSVWNLGSKALVSASQLGGLTCTGPQNVALTGASTSVQIKIATSGSTVAQLERSGAVSMAAFLGIPLFAMLGWVGSRKSQRKNFFRFLGLILLLVGVSYGSGCGGSFSSTSKSTSTGIAPGNYLVQVVGTDQNGNKYYAVVPLDVSSN